MSANILSYINSFTEHTDRQEREKEGVSRVWRGGKIVQEGYTKRKENFMEM
jgi:hypothetical protein